MRKLHSPFERQEVFIAKGESLEGFAPALRIDNAGMESASIECRLESVAYMHSVLAQSLFPVNQEETGQAATHELCLDWDAYSRLESQSRLQVVVLLRSARPIGYCLNILGTTLHYRNRLVCSIDAVYILPAYRAQYAIRLIKKAEAFAKAAGAVQVNFAFSARRDLSSLLTRLGYTPLETIVTKNLG